MTDCFHEPTAADLPRMPGLLGEQVGQVRSAPGQLLALRHATARRVLDDMKRGAIRERILASVRWSASAGLGCEFLCTALERTVPGGRAPRFRRISRPVVFACPARGMLPNSSGSMVDVLSRALRLPYGLPQSSSTISSYQVGPAECLLQCPRLCQRQPLHNERIGVCHVPRPRYFSEQACTAPWSFHRTSSDGGARERSRGCGCGTGAGTMGGNAPEGRSAVAPTHISTRSMARQLPLSRGQHRRSKAPAGLLISRTCRRWPRRAVRSSEAINMNA